ncbi:MAG: EAL domain-containing protein [Frankiales bacterium]|nr:EAL domain-containing protein [Frankiales bacterium]
MSSPTSPQRRWLFLVPGRQASVGAQLLGLFLVGAMFVGALVGFNAASDFHAARSAAAGQVVHEAKTQADSLSAYISTELPTSLQALPSQPGLASGAARDCTKALAALQKLIVGSHLAVLDSHGSTVCRSGHVSAVSDLTRQALAKGVTIQGPITDRVTGKPQIAYGVAFPTPSGKRILAVEEPAMNSLLNSPSGSLSLLLVDSRSGTVFDQRPLAHKDAPVEKFKTSTLTPNHSITRTGPDGVVRIYSSNPVPGTPWIVVAGISRKLAYAHATSALHRNLAIGGLLLVALLILGAVVYRRIATPTRRLRQAIESLTTNEIDRPTGQHVPESGPRELAQLGAAFNEMADARMRSEARLASLVRHASDLVFVVDSEGRVTYATPSVETLLGISLQDVIGSKFSARVHADDRDALISRIKRWREHDLRTATRVDFRLGSDDKVRDVEARVQDLVDDPAVNGIVVTCHDITDRKRAESQLAHAAMHDALTGLPNRALVLDRLRHLMSRTGRSGISSAVLFLDLDRFKLVNDSSGHAIGDELLVQVGERLQAVTRPGDTLGRFGGDEFVIVCEALSSEEAEMVAQRLLDAMQAPFRLSDQELYVTASIGIAIAQVGDEPGDLLRDADAALYRAKERGRAGYALFDDGMRAQVRKRLDIGNRLRSAVDGEGLFLEYQPLVSLTSQRATGVEALLRWRGGSRIVAPDEFIPVAEETGLIVPIGDWVVRESCRQLRKWQREGNFPAGVHVSVNVSARQLTQPDFVNTIAAAIEDSGLAPGDLTLEVTESVLMRDHDAAASTMAVLRAMGISVSIDDFGTGYSSLGYLDRLPVDELKIDRAFVSPLGRRARAGAIIESVVDLAHAVGLTVVAEGVEHADQVKLLTDMGCDVGQGYHFARPLRADDAFAFLTGQRLAIPVQASASVPV